MKHYLSTLLLFMLCLVAHAQGIAVSSFTLNESDLTANQQGTMVFDQNGNKCALIRIQTTQKGFSFDVGSLGITKVDDNKTGEIWVYVPAGVRKIDIRHPQLGSLLGYVFPVSITAARTYVMQLTTGTVHTVVEQDDGKTYLALTVTPANAVVLVDGTLRQLDSDGSLVLRLSRGAHTYNVQAPGYAPQNGTVTLGMQKMSRHISLESVMSRLTLGCETAGASLYVNDVMKGTGSWSGTLAAGEYLLEARKEGYYGQKQTLTLGEKENKTITLPALTARVGSLDVSYTPVDAEVYIDGQKVGTSPDVFRNLLIGTHKVELRKDGYANKSLTVTIEEGQTASLAGALEKGFSSDGRTFTVNGVTFTMIPVEGSTFTMGATSEQGSDAYGDESPAHSVTLSDYSIGQTEVTQALWKAVMGSNPSKFQGDQRPVEKVCWNDCQEFITKLNNITGQNFRLPTEAEWEYAARGGKQSRGYKYSGSNDISDVAWYESNSTRQTHDVATKKPNELGIYDMTGNVWEWCQDWYGDYSSVSQTNPTGASSGSSRVHRGGSWSDDARRCRVSLHNGYNPVNYFGFLGMRLALSE